MIQLGKLPIAGLGIVAGGLLLGAGLAGFANPSPKEPPAPAWGTMLEPPIASGQAPISYQTYPEDLSPPNLADGYAPAVAQTQMRAPVEAAVPRIDYQWENRWAEARSVRDADYAPPADDVAAERTVPHYAALERAGDSPRPARAEAQGDDTAPGDADPASLRTQVDLANPPPIPAGRPKVIHIASADSGE